MRHRGFGTYDDFQNDAQCRHSPSKHFRTSLTIGGKLEELCSSSPSPIAFSNRARHKHRVLVASPNAYAFRNEQKGTLAKTLHRCSLFVYKESTPLQDRTNR